LYPVLGNLSTSTSTYLHPVLVYVLKFPIQDGLPYLFLYSNFHEVRSFVSVNSQWTGIQKYVCVMVSSGTRQCNFLGQRDRSFFIVPGQRDNRRSSKYCHGTELARIACQNLGWDAGRDNHYFSDQIQDGTGTGRDNHYFFPYDFLFHNICSCFRTYFFCFRTSFPVLECPFPVF
jgi:hypothetical protein